MNRLTTRSSREWVRLPWFALLGLAAFVLACSENPAVDADASGANAEYDQANAHLRSETSPDSYMPISVGNRWTYRRTLTPCKEPLYSYELTVEARGTGHRRTGTSHRVSGREVSIEEGIESYHVLREDSDAFVLLPSGEPRGAHGLAPFRLQRLLELKWAIRTLSDGDTVLWEFRRGEELGSVVRTSQIVGLLTPDISLKEQSSGRKITCTNHTRSVTVPAGTFHGTIKNTIEFNGGIDDESLRIERFFARGIGLVREAQFDAAGSLTYSLDLMGCDLN